MTTRQIIPLILAVAGLLSLAMAACGSDKQPALPEPAGMAKGQATFIYFYTDG